MGLSDAGRYGTACVVGANNLDGEECYELLVTWTPSLLGRKYLTSNPLA